MPKRSNEFQKLIASIYKKITPVGGVVTESGMVYDRDANELREVDVLVEYKYAGHDFKIMIECRDRSRKDSVEWIDGLIGKAKSLSVNKIVAVSSKGFAKKAINKANANDIDVLTLKQAHDTDWKNYPIKPKLAVRTGEIYSLKDVAYFKEGVYYPLSKVGLNSPVFYENEAVGTVKEIFEYIFQVILVPQIDEYLKDKHGEIFKTRADLDKPLRVEIERGIPSVTVMKHNNEQIEFSRVKFLIEGSRMVSEIDSRHMVFNNTMVSFGEHKNSDGSKLKFKIIQEADTKKIHFEWNKE